MRYCFVVLALIVFCCFGDGVLVDRSVVIRVTNSENAVSAKRKAIRSAYIKIAEDLLSEKGLNTNDVSNALNQELTEEKILELFSGFIESFSISEEKISFDDYQAKFNFKILDDKFNAWAFSIVSKIMKKSDSRTSRRLETNDIYAKEERSDASNIFDEARVDGDVVVELKNNSKHGIQDEGFVRDNKCSEFDIKVVCYFRSSFAEWMYFYKDKVNRVLDNYKIINFDDGRIKLLLHVKEDDLDKFKSMFDKEGINFFEKGNNVWVIEQKI